MVRHLRLVPPLPVADVPARHQPYGDDPNVALLFFQAASGVCLCRDCAKRRHPAYGGE